MKDYKDRNVANNGWTKVAMSLSICDSDGKFRVFIFVSFHNYYFNFVSVMKINNTNLPSVLLKAHRRRLSNSRRISSTRGISTSAINYVVSN